MIRYAADRGIWVTTCTNGEPVDPEQLVRSGIAEVNFQIAGMSQDTHSTYRVGADLSKTLEKLERTIEWRNQLTDSSHMRVVVGFILMRHNEHEVAAFKEYCESIGVDECTVIGTCLRDAKDAERFLPSDRSYWLYDEAALEEGCLVPNPQPVGGCGWLYSTMTVLANGDVVPCCRDPKGEYVLGNAFEENVYDIWTSDAYGELRRAVAEDSGSLALCRLCSGYNVPYRRSDWAGPVAGAPTGE
jgi:radical SAM protein with 4Fe4S-binding SPASM domain